MDNYDSGTLLTVQQIADRLQLKTSWVYANADNLGAYRVGKYIRFRWDRVLEKLESLPILTMQNNNHN